jgi:hypothetical protein
LNHGDTRSGLLAYSFLVNPQRQSNADERTSQVIKRTLANFQHAQYSLKATGKF